MSKKNIKARRARTGLARLAARRKTAKGLHPLTLYPAAQQVLPPGLVLPPRPQKNGALSLFDKLAEKLRRADAAVERRLASPEEQAQALQQAQREAKLRRARVASMVGSPGLHHNPRKPARRNPTWTTAYKNKLPDSAFLFIEAGGRKDKGGRTVPRTLRHFPYRDLSGRIDLPHLRNAIARIPQSKVKGLDVAGLQARARKLLEANPGPDYSGGPDYSNEPDGSRFETPPRAERRAGQRLLKRQSAAAAARKKPMKLDWGKAWFEEAPAEGITPAQLVKEFEALKARAVKVYPGLARLGLKLDPSVHDSPRHFAMTGADKQGRVSTNLAPEILFEPLKVRTGVLQHEIGHAVTMLGGVKRATAGGYDAVERQADKLAEQIFKTKIYYDSRNVEVSGPGARGKRPRPAGVR